MSDSGMRARGGGHGSSSAAADVADLQPHYVPGASGLFGASRFDRISDEREQAAGQIDRTLKAWRKSKDEEPAQPAYIPESGGQPLNADVRQRMEPKLGADLSGVKVHVGGESQQAAKKLGARAFTVGSEVHFNQGEFAPGTKDGDRLIAHELTHVVQGQKSGVQRKAEEGEEAKGGEGAEVSQPEEPAEKEADAKGDEVADKLHDKKDAKGGKDGKHAKDEANAESGEKEGEEGEEKKEEAPKEAAPAAAAKLYRKIMLKPKTPPKPADPALKAEMDTIKAWVEQEAAKTKTMWSTAAIPVGAAMAKIGAGVGTLAAPGIGTLIGGAAGAVAGALVSIFGIGGKKHAAMEEKAKLLDNIDQLIMNPGVIHELHDYIVALNPDFKTVAAKIEAAAGELTKKQKQKVEYDKKKAAKKGGAAPPEEGKLEKAGHKAHKVGEKAEVAEAGMEVAAKGAEMGAEASHLLEAAAPILETTAHVAQGAAGVLNVFIAGVDAKTWADKSKKYKELKAKSGGT